VDNLPEILAGTVALISGVAGSGYVVADQAFKPTADDAADLFGAEPLGWLVSAEEVDEEEMLAHSDNYDVTINCWHYRQFEFNASHAATVAHVRDVWQAVKADPTLGVPKARVMRRRVRGLDFVPNFRNEKSIHMPQLTLVVNYDSNC
jgi:hypothetical protein